MKCSLNVEAQLGFTKIFSSGLLNIANDPAKLEDFSLETYVSYLIAALGSKGKTPEIILNYISIIPTIVGTLNTLKKYKELRKELRSEASTELLDLISDAQTIEELYKVFFKDKNNEISEELYLFFDTETTGLPKKWKAPVTDIDNWPRLIQIAWTVCNKDGSINESKDFIIKPNGFTIPKEASDVHRITNDKAINEGVDLIYVLEQFNRIVDRSNFIIAHNMSFDEKIIGAEFIRNKIQSHFFKKNKLCTMNASTDFCKIPGHYGYKWPKLSELHVKLFGKDFEEAHNAAADINATVRCFWKMRELNLI